MQKGADLRGRRAYNRYQIDWLVAGGIDHAGIGSFLEQRSGDFDVTNRALIMSMLETGDAMEAPPFGRLAGESACPTKAGFRSNVKRGASPTVPESRVAPREVARITSGPQAASLPTGSGCQIPLAIFRAVRLIGVTALR